VTDITGGWYSLSLFLSLEGAPSKLRLGGVFDGLTVLADSLHRVPLCEHSASHPFA